MHKLIIIVALLFAGTINIYARSGPVKPNVIVIYTDDQGSVDMNIYGSKDIYTPNMDNLAKSGVRFTQFYSTSPICSPSRAALLTGRYPQRAGLPDMAPSQEGLAGMPTEQVTMAEMFKAAGYSTAHIGKWHIGYTPETMPNGQGFDYSYGFMGGCIDNYSHFFYWSGPNRHDLWRNGAEIWEDGKYFPTRMVEEAEQFIEKSKDKPFFLYWAANMVHYPLQGEQKWRDYYKNLPSPRDKYAAFISTMDEKIGQLVQKLKDLGLDKNTIIVFQSDQGHSEEERTFGGGGSAGPYRGSKFSLFEGGIRVPAIISWPGQLPQNEVRDQIAANIDWFPTLAELCDIPLPKRVIDGKNLVPVIRSEKVASPHETFYWKSGGAKSNAQWAVRHGKWKLLHNPAGNISATEKSADNLYLFDIKTDISEQLNLAQKNPDVVKALTAKYENWLKEVNITN